jgi:hypothetical protein
LVAGPLATRVRAGESIPCSGYEERACNNGNIARLCCPAGAKCNFANRPFVACGHETCVDGRDPGRCPAPAPRTFAAKDEVECRTKYGHWAPACIERRVQNACIPMQPTNYTGPGANPAFRTCGPASAARCTTHVLMEDCYPSRTELGKAACDGAWTKVCLGGTIGERCLPTGPGAPTFPAATYVPCDDGSCATGADRRACP